MTQTEVVLEAHRVHSRAHVEHMRLIRNSGLGGYANQNVEVNANDQQRWWMAQQGRVWAWLYTENDVHVKIVGYGMILRRTGGSWSPSAGVLPMFRGRGYGGYIVDDLVRQSRVMGVQLSAVALLTNPAALATHHAEYWTLVDDDDAYAYFKSRP